MVRPEHGRLVVCPSKCVVWTERVRSRDSYVCRIIEFYEQGLVWLVVVRSRMAMLSSCKMMRPESGHSFHA